MTTFWYFLVGVFVPAVIGTFYLPEGIKNKHSSSSMSKDLIFLSFNLLGN